MNLGNTPMVGTGTPPLLVEMNIEAEMRKRVREARPEAGHADVEKMVDRWWTVAEREARRNFEALRLMMPEVARTMAQEKQPSANK